MSPVKKPAPASATVRIARGMPERHIANYLEKMLDFIGLAGSFEVYIRGKIKGSGHHHGTECEGVIQYNAVRIKVQSSDNGSRYLCYLNSKEVKPTHIRDQIMSSLHGGRFDLSMIKKETNVESPPEDVTPPAAPQASEASKEKVSLAGAADDLVQVAMFFISIRLKHGTDAFSAESFSEIIRKDYAPDAGRRTTSQLLRRIVENGYLTSEGVGPKKVYRFTKVGIDLLVEHDKCIAESATNALKIADASQLYEELAKLESKARQHGAAARRLLELSNEIDAETARIEDLRQQIITAEAKRDDLRRLAIEDRSILEDLELSRAVAKYKEIQDALKSS